MIIPATNQGDLNPTINSNILGTDNTTDNAETSLYRANTASSNDLKGFIRETAIKYGLDYEKFNYTIFGESTYNPDAIGPGGISIGISQFTLDTWLGNCSDIDDRRDPFKSIECMGKLWSKGQEYRWDVYCFKYYDQKCVELRNLYPVGL